MNQNKKMNFIIIDDSKLDCFIAEKIIKNIGKSVEIKSFLQAMEALDYVQANVAVNNEIPTIVLVDIQMPIMNGFEFVEAFEKLPHEVTDKFSIYIISSSINENDLSKVNNYSSVKNFINKPLTSSNLSALINDVGE